MASLVTDNEPPYYHEIEMAAYNIQKVDRERTIKGLKPEYFRTWKPLEDNRINSSAWRHGRYPLAHWGAGTLSDNKYTLHVCDGVVKRIGFYDNRRMLPGWANKVKKTGTYERMAIKCIPCPDGKGFITRGPMNSDKLPQEWGIFRQRHASATNYDSYEITFLYCPTCLRNQMQNKADRYHGHRNVLDPNSDMLGTIRISPTEHGQSWPRPLYLENWLHVDTPRRRREYQQLMWTQWNNRIIGITRNVKPSMIKRIINTHDPSKTKHPNLPMKFCVNVDRCENSFYDVMPPRWSLTERGYLCQECFERHKMAAETAVDFTKRGRPGQQRNVRALPLEVAKKIREFGQGGRRRRRRKKRTKKRRKSRRKKKHRKKRTRIRIK